MVTFPQDVTEATLSEDWGTNDLYHVVFAAFFKPDRLFPDHGLLLAHNALTEGDCGFPSLITRQHCRDLCWRLEP